MLDPDRFDPAAHVAAAAPAVGLALDAARQARVAAALALVVRIAAPAFAVDADRNGRAGPGLPAMSNPALDTRRPHPRRRDHGAWR